MNDGARSVPSSAAQVHCAGSFPRDESSPRSGSQTPNLLADSRLATAVTWSALESWSRIASTPNTGLTGPIFDRGRCHGQSVAVGAATKNAPQRSGRDRRGRRPLGGLGGSRSRGPSDSSGRAMAPCSAFPEWRARRGEVTRGPRRRPSPMVWFHVKRRDPGPPPIPAPAGSGQELPVRGGGRARSSRSPLWHRRGTESELRTRRSSVHPSCPEP